VALVMVVTFATNTTLARADDATAANPANGTDTKEFSLLLTLGKALGSSAGSFGASTAIQFAAKLLGLGGHSDVDKAKDEIIKAINGAESDYVKGLIGGSLDSLSTVLEDTPEVIVDERSKDKGYLDSIIRDTDTAINTIKAASGRKDAALAYVVAPDLALAVAVNATASRLQNRPIAILDHYQRMMDMGMDLVGVDVTYPQSKAFVDTSDSKLLWSQANLGGLTPVGDPTSQGELGAGELLGFGGPKLELVWRGV
jgi:hypothetical protein